MISTILSIINKFIPDSNEAMRVARDLEAEYTKRMELQSEVIRQEMSGEGWTAKWRPVTMLIFVGMVTVHWIMYDVVPFIVVTFNLPTYTPMDPGYTEGLLDLIKLGLGGYIGGRTAEKIVKIWKEK